MRPLSLYKTLFLGGEKPLKVRSYFSARRKNDLTMKANDKTLIPRYVFVISQQMKWFANSTETESRKENNRKQTAINGNPHFSKLSGYLLHFILFSPAQNIIYAVHS